MVLQLAFVHLRLWVVGRILVEVRQEDSLRVGRLDVFARAAVAMTACANLVVETTVDLDVALAIARGDAMRGFARIHTLSCSVPKIEAR